MIKRQTKRIFLRLMICAAAAGAVVAAPAQAAEKQKTRSYTLTTATTGGTYYPVGVAIATLIKVKLEPKHKITMSAISSAGSGENVKLIREKEADFAIVQGLFGAWAWNGTGKIKGSGPQKHLRSVTMLWQNVEHFVMRADDAKTGTIDDLKLIKGEKFSIGKRNSGTEGSGRTILGGLGIDPEKSFDVAYLGYTPSADAMKNGTIRAMNTPGGVPVGAVTQLLATMGSKARILDFTDDQVTRANSGMDLWTRYVIPANTYPGQTKAVQTIAQPNFLAVHKDVPADDVYMITKTIYENLAFLNAIHKATKAMDIKKAIAGVPAPLHPGAARYYREIGLQIPDRLIAK